MNGWDVFWERVFLTLFFIERHEVYVTAFLLTIVTFGLVILLRYRVSVPDHILLFVDTEHAPIGKGRYFVPWQYREVDMRTREFSLNVDDLSPSLRVDSYRGGIIQPDSVVTSSPGRKDPPVIVRWKPDASHLGDYLRPSSIGDFQKAVQHFFKLHPPRAGERYTYDLCEWVKGVHCGIAVEWVYVGGKAKTSGSSVSLADDMEIPYEG